MSYRDSPNERMRAVVSSTHKLSTGFEGLEFSCCCSDWMRGMSICAAPVGSLVSPVAVAQNYVRLVKIFAKTDASFLVSIILLTLFVHHSLPQPEVNW